MKEVIIPRFGDSVDRVTILFWKVKEGDAVKPGDILCEVETEKAAGEIESFYEGTVVKIALPEGSEVSAGAVAAYIGEPGEITPKEIPSAEARSNTQTYGVVDETGVDATSAVTDKADSLSGDAVLALPKTRRIARDLHIDLRNVTPTGPRGEVTEADVRKASLGF